jgi:hypothetical protein
MKRNLASAPRRTEAIAIGTTGEHLVTAHLTQFANCSKLYSDVGLDLLCQLVRDREIGESFYVQVKSIRRLASRTRTIRFRASTLGFWSKSTIPIFLVVCLLEPSPRFLWRLVPADLTGDSITLRAEDFSDETVLAGIAAAVAPAQRKLIDRFAARARLPDLIAEGTEEDGTVVSITRVATGARVQWVTKVWLRVVEAIRGDPKLMFNIPPHIWEEIVAGAFFLLGFDEVVITPRSGDHGRDLIVTRFGIGSVKIIVSVKAYGEGRLVRYEDVRALLGVLHAERDASKAMLITTSDFPTRMKDDPFIGPWTPFRLQLLNGENLRRWLIATRTQLD